MSDILLSSPLWSLFLFSLIPISLKVLNKNKESSLFLSSGVILIGIFTSLVLLFLIWPSSNIEIKTLFSGAMVFNELRAIASLVLLLVGTFIVLMSIQQPQVNENIFSEILFLKMGSLQGLFILLWSGHLLMAFIGLELASLSFYLLIALGRTGSQALKASFKYFVLGSVASAILLYGISFVLGSSGHFDLQRIFQQSPELMTSSRLLTLGLIFVLVGFLFKVSIFPFHFWLPDVYRGSFTPLLVLMATGLKLVIFILLFEWTKNMFSLLEFSGLLSLFQWLAVLSVLFGNIIALLQKDFKKMLLFSTVAHSGYLLMILIVSQMGFSFGKTALLYYLMVYIGTTLGIFICLRPFEKRDSVALSLSELDGLVHQKPFHAFLITLFLLSLAGIPPTGGFVSKLFVFQALLDQGLWWMLFWAILGSSVALFYYLKPIALMYMQKDLQVREKKVFVSLPRFLTSCLMLLSGFVLVSGLIPSLFIFG
ncbi:MAG: NADH-quinone oxidoreductase subunit N [Oligoflexia bacterium]|nr:NADH-quinone oxidoreductase subunit N [Oligoflexia bacterium]